MYGGRGAGGAGGGPLVGLVPTVAGAAVLPNTGDNHLLMVISIVCIAVGSAVTLSSLALYMAKKTHRA